MEVCGERIDAPCGPGDADGDARRVTGTAAPLRRGFRLAGAWNNNKHDVDDRGRRRDPRRRPRGWRLWRL
eukprot:879852-Prymnesium_polylepis.1